MKKLALSLAIISALNLSACNDETIEDVKNEVEQNGTSVTPQARIVFDPGAAEPRLSIPNDILFSGTTDATLNLPVDDATDFSDPTVAMSALDGWSTTNPFVLEVDFPEGMSIDATSVSDPASIKAYEAVMGGDTTDTDCTALTRGLACKVVAELTFGVDFFAKAIGNDIAIIPLKPLKAKTNYLVALTNNLKDNTGKAVAPSVSYELVRQDISTLPLATESQLTLQGLTNSFENVIAGEGLAKESLIYTFAMTTQSTTDVLFTVKNLLAAPLQAGGLPPVISVADTGFNVAQVFSSQGVELSESSTALYSTAQYYKGSVQLPYYSGVPTLANPKAPVTDWWTAQCDSAAMLAGLAASNPNAIPAGPLSESDGVCMAISAAGGLEAPGLRDLSSVIALDVERNLTKYNPVPKQSGISDIPWVSDPSVLEVQMTVPVISATTDAVRATFGLPPLTDMPENGWPVVMMQHGIGLDKETLLAMTGVLSAFGYVTVAIDHPLHGSRGFDLDNVEDSEGDKHDEINASTISPTHYMSLGSLLTMRDNVRQSTSDMLGLRLALNAVQGTTVDTSEVHFLGYSLGAVTGINLVALANTPLDPKIDPAFSIKTNSQAMPGIMIAHFLMESGEFADVIKSNLTYSASAEFKTIVDGMFPLDENGKSTASEAELVATYLGFYAALSDEQQQGLDDTFSQFTIAAQTVLEAGDPVNFVQLMQSTDTPTHLIEVVGTGVSNCEDISSTENCSDQIIPNTVTTSPIAGTEAAISLLGLPSVSVTSAGSGAVRFLYGHHGTLLTPAPNYAAPDEIKTAQATQEMQAQVAGFFAAMGQQITVTDTDVVK